MIQKASSLLLVVALLAGCVAGSPDNTGRAAVAVEMLPSSPAKVSRYSLRQEDGTLVVSGRVTSLNPIRISGHVDPPLPAHFAKHPAEYRFRSWAEAAVYRPDPVRYDFALDGHCRRHRRYVVVGVQQHAAVEQL